MLSQEAEQLLEDTFADETQRAFSFAGRLGYLPVKVGAFFVDYRSARGYLLVWLNPQPGHELYNVDIRVGPLRNAEDESKQLIEGSSLFQLADATYQDMPSGERRKYSRLAFPANHDGDWRSQLRDSLRRMARILESEFSQVLRDDDGILDHLAADRARGQEEGLAALELRQTRPKAREAFKDGNWEAYIELLEPLRKHLKRHELMRIDYARRKLGEGV